MIKGCQREMVMLRVDESEIFESAWFVLRRERVAVSDGDMLAEANRIVRGTDSQEKRRSRLFSISSFVVGFCLGAIIFALIAFFILG